MLIDHLYVLFRERAIQNFALILIVLVVTVLNCKSSLYILDIRHLPDI